MSTHAFGVIVLAAGASSRMGQPKLLLPWAGGTILAHLLTEWKQLGATQIGVVLGHANLLLEAELDQVAFPREDRIVNPAPEQGMFSSILAAARWQGWREALTHWIVALGDQPHLKRETLRKLIEFSAENPEATVQPSYHQRPRHPIVLPRAEFREMARTEEPTLKHFLCRRPVLLCEVDDAGLEIDLDTPEDYARALRQFQ